jgi:hypothetical protein
MTSKTDEVEVLQCQQAEMIKWLYILATVWYIKGKGNVPFVNVHLGVPSAEVQLLTLMDAKSVHFTLSPLVTILRVLKDQATWIRKQSKQLCQVTDN